MNVSDTIKIKKYRTQFTTGLTVDLFMLVIYAGLNYFNLLNRYPVEIKYPVSAAVILLFSFVFHALSGYVIEKIFGQLEVGFVAFLRYQLFEITLHVFIIAVVLVAAIMVSQVSKAYGVNILTLYLILSIFILLLATLIIGPFVTIILGKRAEESEDIRDIAARIAHKMGLKIEEVYYFDTPGWRYTNAATIGGISRNKMVFIRGDCRKHLNYGDIEAVIAHELAHAKLNHVLKGSVYFILSHSITPLMLVFSAAWLINSVFGSSNKVAFTVIFVLSLTLYLLVWFWVFKKKRDLEFEADSLAAETVGADKLINALKKLSDLNLIPETHESLLSTHPSIKRRVLRLGGSHE